MLKKDTELKKCFFPERWMERKTNQEDIDPIIRDTFIANRTELDKLIPPERDILCNTGWDNALNHMGAVLLGNLKVQALTPMSSRLYKFVEKVKKFETGTNFKAVHRFMLRPLQPTTSISILDFEWVVGFRNLIALPKDKGIYDTQVLSELSNITWTLHIWLQTVFEADDGAFSRLPYSSIGRKYAYLDNKIANALLKSKTKKKMLEITQNHGGSELQKLLGLTSQCFNKRRSEVRKAMRKKYKNNKKKFHRKWRKIGRSTLPSKGVVKSISTDGVGLRLSIEYNPMRPINRDQEVRNTKNAFKIGSDNGRVNLAATTDELGTTTMVKKTNFYDAQRHDFFEKWEKNRMTGTAYGGALAAMSQAGGFKNASTLKWTTTLTAMTDNIAALKNELLEFKDRAKHKMFRFRRKKSFLDCSWKRIIKPAIAKKKSLVIMGVGDGSFSHTGKGEQSAPVQGIMRSLERVKRMIKDKIKVQIEMIDEYNTTKCCHCCGKVMDKIVENGKENLRYRLCKNCNNETVDKRRNRDVNASKNMLNLLTLKLNGLPRPTHLVNPYK
jgi:hypothetical protein